MWRVTITISDEIEASLTTYIREQKVSSSLTAIMQTALQEFLTCRGFVPSRILRITPAKKSGGAKDVSVDHDRYLAAR